MTKKLLVADDSPTIQKVISLALAGEDIQVERAVDGQGLVEVIQATRPDLILLDASLPGRSGYEICRSVRADAQLEATPVILLTGVAEAFDEEEARRVGCSAHLSKPFDSGELLRTVQGLLGSGSTPAGPAKGLVSARTRASFLGSGSILDVFGPSLPKPQPPRRAKIEQQPTTVAIAEPLPPPPPPPAEAAPEAIPAASAARQVIPFPVPKVSEAQAAPVELPDEILNAIAERAVRQMSPDVIREIAWEVVPELAEILIRQYLDEHGLARK